MASVYIIGAVVISSAEQRFHMIYLNINNAIISNHLPVSTQEKLSPNIYKYQKIKHQRK